MSCYEKVDFNNPLDADNNLVLPTNLNIVGFGEDSLKLNWQDNIHYTNPDQAKYIDMIIEQSTDNKSFLSIDTVSAYGSGCVIHHIFETNKTYYFRTYAMFESKISKSSNTVSGEIKFLGPSGLSIISMTKTQINLSWQNNNKTASRYNIEMSKDGSDFDSVASVDGSTSKVSLNGNFDSTTVYIFRIIAKSNYNSSPYSNEAGSSLNGNTYLGLKFSYVEGGDFIMGNSNHNVTLSSFYMSKYEITQKQWHDVIVWKQKQGGNILNDSPSYFKGDSLPVESVTWKEVNTWIGYLNQKEYPRKFRLPTEAEWEFAAKGGNDSHGYIFSGGDKVEQVGWTGWSYTRRTMNVGEKLPNELGIYDMTGNVAEWCSDWYAENFPEYPETNPTGPTEGKYKVTRGGYYNADPYLCTVTARMWGWWNDNLSGLDQALKDVGFRIVKQN